MKLLGCICLVAGTAIGAGMIALPISLAKFGLVLGSLLMLGTWAISYFSALLNLELNLRAGKGLPLGALSLHFSSYRAYFAGSTSLLLLCFSLLCAYLYGGASTLVSLDEFPLSFNHTAIIFATCLGLIMLCSIKKIDKINRFLFLGLILVVGFMLIGILWHLDYSHIPASPGLNLSLKDVNIVLPIVFTSFGFQVIFHTLTNYANNDSVMLKKAFFWGSLIPAIVYIAWTFCVCGLIYYHDSALFEKMTCSGIEVGEMIKALSHITQSPFMHYLVWVISFLFILTSAFGVLLGLIDTLKTKHPILNHHWVAVITAIIPALCVCLVVPNAFIKVLSFAGMILSFMALLLPMYLLYCSNRADNNSKYWYPVLKNPFLQLVIAGYGLWVIGSELQNIFSRI